MTFSQHDLRGGGRRGVQHSQNGAEEMIVLQHALCLKGGFGSAETCLKMKQLVQMMRSMLFTLCICIVLLLPQSTYLPCS